MSSPITIKDYFALAGSRFTDKDARTIGPVLAELSQQKEVTPAAVVEAAQSANCPLHAYFEWDDRVAAGKYREGQASEIINTIRVRVVSTEDGQERSVRAYRIQHLETKPLPPLPPSFSDPRVGRPRADASVFRMMDEEEMIADALRDLQAWRLKYRPMAEFLDQFKDVTTVIMNQIGEFLQEFEAQPSLKPLEAIEDLKLWLERHADGTTTAAQFAEQFKYMRLAIEDAEKAFDPDTTLEGPLAQENRMLRERLQQLEGDQSKRLAVKVQTLFSTTRSEALVLATLYNNKGAVSTDTFMTHLYTDALHEPVDPKILDVYICKLRKKLSDFGISIETVWGTGYLLPDNSRRLMHSLLEAA